jgi:hypothetical protein
VHVGYTVATVVAYGADTGARGHETEREGTMGGMRKIGLCLVGALAIATTAATTASAAEYELESPPEFGRCVKVAPKTGTYSGARCLTPAPGKGKYNWLAGPGAKPKFTAAVEAVLLNGTGAGKASIHCEFGEVEGEYTGAKTLTVKKLILSDCVKAGAKTVLEGWCQNIGAFRGEVSTNELAGALGYIEHVGNKTKVGLDLKAAIGTALATFECGGASTVGEHGTGTGTLMEVEGSVIGRIKLINKMSTENVVTYKVIGGAQAPEKFEGGVKDTLTLLTGLAKTAEPATMSTFAEVGNEEAMEIKSR